MPAPPPELEAPQTNLLRPNATEGQDFVDPSTHPHSTTTATLKTDPQPDIYLDPDPDPDPDLAAALGFASFGGQQKQSKNAQSKKRKYNPREDAFVDPSVGFSAQAHGGGVYPRNTGAGAGVGAGNGANALPLGRRQAANVQDTRDGSTDVKGGSVDAVDVGDTAVPGFDNFNAWAQGVNVKSVDGGFVTAFYKPSFVEDPWEKLLRVRGAG